MNLNEIGWKGEIWISLAKDKEHWRVLLNTVTNLQVSQNAANCLTK
jgi:hypothetical protein